MTTPTGQCPKCRAVNAYTALNCIECGARLPWADAVKAAAPVSPPVPADDATSDAPKKGFQVASSAGLQRIGVLFAVMGGGMVLYFLLIFDPTIAVPGFGSVVNFSLMAQRQNGLIFGFGLLILGAILILFPKLKQ